MIQEIASSSGGATIKILSDKKEGVYTEDETVVSIIGSKAVVYDALTKIIEQIEYFKNGGPVLSSGKAIFQSIPEQFRSSIILRDGKITKIGGENPFLADPSLLNNDSNPMMNSSNYNNNTNNNYHLQQQPHHKQHNPPMINNMRINNYHEKRNSPIRRKSKSRSRSYSRDRKHYSEDRKQDKYDKKSSYRNREKENPRDRERRDDTIDNADKRRENREIPRENKDTREKWDKEWNRQQSMRDNNREPEPRNDYYRGGRRDSFNNNNNINLNASNILEERKHSDRNDRRENRNSFAIKDQASKIFYDENGVQKLVSNILVPDNLVSLLIGKNGENIKSLMKRSGSIISFAKEVRIFILFLFS